jgi:hypothetical protein
VPETVTCATKPELAWRKLERAKAARVLAEWVTGGPYAADVVGATSVLVVAKSNEPLWADLANHWRPPGWLATLVG